MRGVSGFLGRSSNGFSWSESEGGASSEQRVSSASQRSASPGSAGESAGWERLGGVVGAEFRGQFHEGSFRVLGPELMVERT